ncbi:MAG: GntR family transcriptional regulator [Sphingobacteriaceae bacterium]|nr:MAG: GntR family transcriptional regulator [Sphingobacteriaceae bacterium]
MPNYLKILKIDEYSITPIYIQLKNGFISGLEQGLIAPGDVLPSINDLSCALDKSRTTVERFYNALKKERVIATVPGKGAYVLEEGRTKQPKVLLLFNKLSAHKKIIYDALAETLNDRVAIDFYVYNNNYFLFKKILSEKMANGYAKIVIVPYFLENEDQAIELINTVPDDKLIIMDKLLPGLTGQFAAVYEDFELDIYEALNELLVPLSKYKSIKLIFPTGTYYSSGIRKGFEKFCADHFFNFGILSNFENEVIQASTVYINIAEEDLVLLIQKIRKTSYIIGKEVGIISYNETAIKQVILEGITTISTSFTLLGSKTAEVLLAFDRNKYRIPFIVRLRPSL